ncbi:hypothetical protein HDU96_010119 [Phlyctochytrium bullatum]|nr:hypothetical protein HDU96_010119 [Phlyctochytrium bullatum]
MEVYSAIAYDEIVEKFLGKALLRKCMTRCVLKSSSLSNSGLACLIIHAQLQNKYPSLHELLEDHLLMVFCEVEFRTRGKGKGKKRNDLEPDAVIQTLEILGDYSRFNSIPVVQELLAAEEHKRKLEMQLEEELREYQDFWASPAKKLREDDDWEDMME